MRRIPFAGLLLSAFLPVVMACILHGIAGAQQNRPRRARMPIASDPAIVPDDQAMAAKQQLLAKIKRSGGDAKRPANVVLILAHKEEPFFVYVPFNAVHTPLEATDEYLNRFPNEADKRQQAYNAMTSALDDAVGRIVKALDDTGVDDNTLVIFLNDNGGPIYTQVQSNAPLRLGKLFLFEGGIRVPMIVRWQGVLEPGTVYGEPVSSLDVFPTACAVAGIDLPSGLSLDGVDLLPHLKGDNADPPHDALFWSNGPNKAVRLANWKLIVAGDHKFLFDLDSDIGETENLAGQKPEVVRKLDDALKEWQSQMKPPAWPSKPNRRKVDIDGVPYELNI